MKKILFATLSITLAFFIWNKEGQKKEQVEEVTNLGQEQVIKAEDHMPQEHEVEQATQQHVVSIKKLQKKMIKLQKPEDKMKAQEKIISSFEKLPDYQQYNYRYKVVKAFTKSKNQLAQDALLSLVEKFAKQDLNLLSKVIDQIHQYKTLEAHHKTVEYAKEVYQANKKFILDETFQNIVDGGNGALANAREESVFHSFKVQRLEEKLKEANII